MSDILLDRSADKEIQPIFTAIFVEQFCGAEFSKFGWTAIGKIWGLGRLMKGAVCPFVLGF